MEQVNLKQNAIKGAVWTSVEKIVRQLIIFVIGIILARLIDPEEFGIIGMISIFIAISQTFADSGLSSALIQKKDRTNTDCSTIFYYNLGVSVFFYVILFFTAPLIAEFYKTPLIKQIIRVVAFSIVLTSLSAVQGTRLTIDLKFKEQSLVSILSALISGLSGVTLAYLGFGVWALVAQTLINQVCITIGFWFFSKWFPSKEFSKDSFKQLWKFGSKLLGSGLINTLYSNLYTLVIGKAFTAAEVGYYNRANQFVSFPVDTVQSMAVKVNYPVLSKLQDDDSKLVGAYKKLLSTPLYVLYPALTGLALVAEPLVQILIGSKWLPCVPYLQILAIGYMFTPLTTINLNLLYVKGRTDIVLKLELIKKPIAFAILIASIPFGIKCMVIGKALYEFIAFSFNCYYTGKFLGYGELKQLRELLPTWIYCAIMASVVLYVMKLCPTNATKLIAGTISGIITYIVVSVVAKDSNYYELKEALINLLKSKFKK